MAMEIEKLNAIQEKVEQSEKTIVEQIKETISTDFRAMIEDTRIFLMTGEKISRDFSNSIAALKKLKGFGDQYGIEFPEINTNEEAAIYILKFGSEIVKGK